MRIRTRQDAAGRQDAIITFKGPRQESVLKSRSEIEFTVGDSETAGQFLERSRIRGHSGD